MLNHISFLIHFGYEICKAKQKGLGFGYLCCHGNGIYIDKDDIDNLDILIDIEKASDFGFFTTQLIDAGEQAWDAYPVEYKIVFLPPHIFESLRPKELIDRDMISEVLYQGMPEYIQVYTPKAAIADILISDIKIKPEDTKYIDAFLACNRMAPQMMAKSYPYGIPCNIKDSNELS